MNDYYDPIWLDAWERDEIREESKWDEDYEDDERDEERRQS